MLGDLLQAIVLYVAFLGAPVLVAWAFVSWRKRYRSEFPAWRARLGLSSMVIITVYWIFPVFLILADRFLGSGRLVGKLADLWGDSLIPAMLLSAALAASLKGIPRTLTIAASILEIVILYASTVV